MAEEDSDLCVQQNVIRSHFFLRSRIFGFYPRFLGYVVSGSWFLVCIPFAGVGLMSNQALFSYPHKLYARIALTCFPGRISLQMKGFVAGLVFLFHFGNLQGTFLYRKGYEVGGKALCRQQLSLFIFNELPVFCLQQWGLAVSLWSVLATQCLGKSLDYLNRSCDFLLNPIGYNPIFLLMLHYLN